jgi:hypothetical protein
VVKIRIKLLALMLQSRQKMKNIVFRNSNEAHFLHLYMMRINNRILFILLTLLPAVALCIDNKKTKVIVPGRWKEIVRMASDSSVQSFTDTLYMTFSVKDSFSYRHRNGFVYEGIYTVSEDSILDMGYSRYKVVSRKPSMLVLTNDKGIFQLEPDKSEVVKTIVIKKEDSTRPVNSVDEMIGKWTVYKRTAPGPGTIDMSRNIRSIYVTGPSTDGKQGYIYSGTDADNNPSWYIKELGGGQSLNCEGKTPRTLKVVRCQDGEMILEEEEMKYFLKLYQGSASK